MTTEPKKKRSPTRISPKQYYQLCEYVKLKYAAEGKTDKEFAVLAAQELNMPIVEAHVSTARDVFSIPSTRDVKREENRRAPKLDSLADFSALEKRIAHLEACAIHYGIFALPAPGTLRFPVDPREI